MRKIRIAIVGESPCHACTAACCRQNGHEFAALLRGDEVRKFAAFSVGILMTSGIVERVLPYREGKCQFLGEDDRCRIYEDRPGACREFQCVSAFNVHGVGRHGEFLERNEKVKKMLELID